MTSTSLKVLVVGSVFGKYSKLFKRISDVNLKAGPFDLLLCIGDFFGNDTKSYSELLNSSIDLPNLPVYILGRISKEFREMHKNVTNFDEGFELLEGITFLGRSGILTTSQGLRIGYLNGSYSRGDSLNKDDDNLEYFTKKDYESLLISHTSSASVLDILLTNQWPKNIFTYTNDDFDESLQKTINDNSSLVIAILCKLIRPRYHFAGGIDIFYERPPFRNHQVLQETARNVTRFYSIADIVNTKKMKWIYAFNVVPGKNISHHELTTQPIGTTENPFIKFQEYDLEDELSTNNTQLQSNQYFFAIDSSNGDNPDKGDEYSKRRRNNNRDSDRYSKKQLKVDLDNCWFCLASPNVDKTLIVSVGEYSYLALAKGGLTNDHMLILPIEHIRSTIEIEEESLKTEINKFKSALCKLYKKRDMVPIFFERNFKTAHFQIQVIGLPESKAPLLKQAVAKVFSKLVYHELALDDELLDELSSGVPYFLFECPDYYKFFVRINTRVAFFPMQIGRQLLADDSLLNCPERVDWKKCTNSAEEAKNLTQQIRKEFKEFDFTIV